MSLVSAATSTLRSWAVPRHGSAVGATTSRRAVLSAALRPRTPARGARLGRLGVGRHDPLPVYSGPRLHIWGFQNGTARSSATTTA